MRTCLLIGFEYTKDMFLPGIEQDISQILKHIQSIEPDRITILSDIPSKRIPDSEHTSYKKFKTTKKFLKVVSRTVESGNQVFLYYTGHARKGKFLLPNDDKVKMSSIRKILQSSTSPTAEILCLLDCCESTGLDLGFQIGSNKIPTSSQITQKIICISSSSEGQRSICTKSGSIFTSQVIKRLSKRQLKLDSSFRELIIHKLHKTFKKKLGIKIDSTSGSLFEREFGISSLVLITLSHPNLNSVWSWCLGFPSRQKMKGKS